MEEIRKAANAVYANLSDELKKQMEDLFHLFKSMNKNGDGNIIRLDQELMMRIMTSYSNNNNNNNNTEQNRRMLELIDENGEGTLQFNDFVTLVYMLASPIPWCNGCGDLIGGLFFTCTQCRLGNKGVKEVTYDLCIPCYHGRRFVHEHTSFVDNFSLLAQLQQSVFSSLCKTSSPQSSDGSKLMLEKVKKSLRRFAEFVGLVADTSHIPSTTSDSNVPDLFDKKCV